MVFGFFFLNMVFIHPECVQWICWPQISTIRQKDHHSSMYISKVMTFSIKRRPFWKKGGVPPHGALSRWFHIWKWSGALGPFMCQVSCFYQKVNNQCAKPVLFKVGGRSTQGWTRFLFGWTTPEVWTRVDHKIFSEKNRYKNNNNDTNDNNLNLDTIKTRF